MNHLIIRTQCFPYRPDLPYSKMIPLQIDPTHSRYDALIGTGGVGSGKFFALDGDHTLGREESRGGRFLDRQDYCKLHIIAHYVKILMGPGFVVMPASKIGDDDEGRRLMGEMNAAGLDLRYMEVLPGEQTLFSFCFVYPNGEGGNLTTSNAANSRVDAAWIDRLEAEFRHFRGRGIALAAPEAPLPARRRLLELGGKYQFYRAASLTAGETTSAEALGVVECADLLALNLEEAAMFAGIECESQPEGIVHTALERLKTINPKGRLSITGGCRGSWCWDGKQVVHTSAIPNQVVSTAGAGDAHLAAVLGGVAAGLSLAQAHQLGALAGSAAISSPHTIHKELDRRLLLNLASTSGVILDREVIDLLKGPIGESR